MTPQTILITGCSTGIGHDAALALTARGHRVIASCRKQDDVQKLRDLGCEAVQLDVNDSLSLTTAFSEVLTMAGGRLDILINNAGYGQMGALEDLPRDALRNQFETNVFGLMELSRLAIPVMRQQGHGRIINLSSVLGLISLPFRGAYNASKYAVEGICDTLRLELKSAGIQVICIEPGPIESRFRDSAIEAAMNSIDMEHSAFIKQYQSMVTEFRQQKNDSVLTKKPTLIIKKLIHAIESAKPKAKYPATLPTYLFIVLKRILSVKMLDRVLLLISRREMK